MKNIGLIISLYVLIVLSCGHAEINDPKEPLASESPPPSQAGSTKTKFKDMLGINAFEWNFGDQRNPILEARAGFIRPFSAVRHYLDWRQIETEKGKYGYNPTPRGGWEYDEIYKWCVAQDIKILACIKTIPDWLNETYPPEKRDRENVPAPYGADLSDPASYIEFGKLAFQYAARYGRNRDVDPSLVHVEPVPHYNPNEKIIGMGLVTHIECNNEPNRWWKPDKVAQQTPQEYAANLSAFYDGHKGALGPDVGVKNADPAMQVVMGGLATAHPQFVADMVDWCRIHRGLKADGTVDLCFDVINYHHYAHNRDSEPRANQRGIAPELSPAAELARSFRSFADEQAYGIEVWNTEVGYDVNHRSVQRAIPIGDKTALETHADWNLRTALLYARNGVDRLFFYMLHDVSHESTTQYASSGFVHNTGNNVYVSKPAWDYVLQAGNLIGEYYYQETLAMDPIVDVYALDGKKVYVLAVPDEKERKDTYELQVENSKQVRIHELVVGATEMKTTIKNLVDGKITVHVTETPIFVEAL